MTAGSNFQAQPQTSSQRRKEFYLKILSGFLIAAGIGIAIASVVFQQYEFLLGVSIPVLVAGFGVLGQVLDPRTRYFVTYENHLHYNAQHHQHQQYTHNNALIFSRTNVNPPRYMSRMRRVVSEIWRRLNLQTEPVLMDRQRSEPTRQQTMVEMHSVNNQPENSVNDYTEDAQRPTSTPQMARV